MSKPVIIGMNNPISMKPEHALYPWPEGCAGNRLWKMLNENVEGGVRMTQYVAAFERTNLCIGPWHKGRARGTAEALRLYYPGRTLVLLGTNVRDAFGLAPMPVGDPFGEPNGDDSVTLYYQVPHPSGRNLWYNDEANRQKVGQLLASLYRRSKENAQ